MYSSIPSTIKSSVFEADKYVIIEYNAISTPKKYAAAEKIITLIMMITSPIVVPNFLLKYNARTSVPSITAPPLIDKPIPAPKKKPPKTATRILSLVTFGKSTLAKTNAKPPIASAVFTAKLIPTVLCPIIMKGKLISGIK